MNVNDVPEIESSLDSLETLPGGILISISKSKHKILMWNTTDGSLLKTLSTQLKLITKLVIIDEYTLAFSSYDGYIEIWNLINGLRIQHWKTIIYPNNIIHPNTMQLLPNRLIATGNTNGLVGIWNLNNGTILINLKGHNGQVISLELINQTILASGSMDCSIKLWDLTTWTIKLTIPNAHKKSVNCLKLISKGILASGSWDSTIKIWNTLDGTIIKTLSTLYQTWVFNLNLISEDILVSNCDDHTIKMWQISTGLLIKTLATSIEPFASKTLNIDCKFY